MTDNEIDQAIAEHCGWKRHRSGVWIPPGPDWDGPPNYCNDLNAMHEVVMAQNWAPVQQMAFMAYLAHKRGDFALVNATARQRAEAFLRTVGKWQESPSIGAPTPTQARREALIEQRKREIGPVEKRQLRF